MTQQVSFEQLLGLTTQDIIRSLTDAMDHKKKLTEIVTNDKTDDKKIVDICDAILDYNKAKRDESNFTLKEEKDNSDGMIKLEILTNMLENHTTNIKIYTDVFDRIKETIRNKEIEAAEKINAIKLFLL
jgi:hypothetical protein